MTFLVWRRITDSARCLCFVLVVLIAVAPPARALIVNGEPAIDELGQFSSLTTDTTANYTKNCFNNGASQIGFANAGSGTIDPTNHWLFIADSGNSRVLVFPLNSSNQISSKSPSYVLGQANFLNCTAKSNNASQSQFNLTNYDTAVKPAVDPANQLLYVPDVGNNRVMVFSTASMSSGENATYVLGHTNYTNSGSSTTQSGMIHPTGAVLDTTNNWLYVADAGNNRVMVFPAYGNAAWTGTGENASYVIGQAGFTAGSANQGGSASQSSLSTPMDVAIDVTNQWLYVADEANNRVMVFPAYANASWAGSGENASYELGQASGTSQFTSTSSATSQSGLNTPAGLAFDSVNNRLFVTDVGNTRVMVFGASGLADGENASYVIGQASFLSNTYFFNPGATNSGFFFDTSYGGVIYDSTNNVLYVSDSGNNRVLLFNVSTSLPSPSSPSQTGSDGCTIANSALYCWGVNSYGEGALGNTTEYLSPQPAGTGETGWSIISGGYPSACGIAGGALYCWGGNLYGEAGQGNTTQYTTPQQVGTDTTWTAVSSSNSNNGTSGPDDACGIDNGKLYCWGQNLYGEIGNGGPNHNTVFATSVTSNGDIGGGAGGVSAANAICAARATAAGLSGTFLAWMATTTGTDDPNTTFTHSSIPYEEVNGTVITANWTTLLSGQSLTNGITLNESGSTVTGDVWTNVSATSGHASTSGASTTRNCNGWTNGTSSDQGNFGTIGSTSSTWTKNSTQAACNNTYNILCFSQSSATNEQNSPVQIGTDTTWTAVSTNGNDTCGIDNGKLYCWGENKYGELGLGNNASQIAPQQVGIATNWIAVSQGGESTCGIRGSGGQGSLWCWGGNNSGNLGQGNTTASTTPIQVGSATNWTAVSAWGYIAGGGGGGDVCGISGGALYCWGANSQGEDGIGNKTQQDSPVQVGSATNWTAISMGNSDACGIQGGQLYCWGWNNSGEDGLGNETQNSTPQPVAIYNSVATDLLGQYNSISSTSSVNWSGNGFNNGPTPLGLASGWGCSAGYNNVWGGDVAIDPANHYLFVSDVCNNRVLVYTLNTDNSIPTASGGHTASYVLGQTSLQGQRLCEVTQSGMCQPMGLAVDSANQRLFVSDYENNRVMVFGYASGFSNGMNAAYVLGQPNFTSYNGNGSWPNSTANNMNGEYGIAYDANDNWLFVADTFFSRIMVFNVAPGSIATGENASYELGQSSFTSYSYPQSTTPAQNTVYFPHGVAYDPVNERLFVADQQFSRVLVFNVAPGSIASNENASYVLGQSSFTSSSCSLTQSGMCGAQDVSYDPNSGRLFMTDSSYVRALVFNTSPGFIANGENASWVIGASNFTSQGFGSGQHGWSTGNEFTAFGGIRYDPGSGRLFIDDPSDNRVLIFEGSYGAPNFMQMLPD